MLGLRSLGAVLGVPVVMGCSSSGLSTPSAPACDGGSSCIDARSDVVTVGDGGDASDGHDASPDGSCPAFGSQCDVCGGERCCAQLEACGAVPDCGPLGSCVLECGGRVTCIDKCEQTYPNGVGAYQAYASCQKQHCTACTEQGVCDPCVGTAYPCAPGLMCNGAWCTRSCTSNSDCVGIGVNGSNYSGYPNHCIQTDTGFACAPDCGQGCSAFGDGMTCVGAMDVQGTSVTVCGAASDASGG